MRLSGANANNGTNAGAFATNTNNAAPDSNANASAPLYFAVRKRLDGVKDLATWRKMTNAQKDAGRPITVRTPPSRAKQTLKHSEPQKQTMKRYGNLFKQVVRYGNLEQAFHNAARHKTHRSEVIEYGSHLETNLLQLQRELITDTYHTSEYKTFIIYEPKERKVFKLLLRDRVVHWAVMQMVEPIWLSNFTRDIYSCIRGRGIHPLLYKLRRDLKTDPEGTRYYLKIDVRKFYPSIGHEIMKQVTRRKLRDARLLALLDGIVDSAENEVPIGNCPPQFFANFYLSELDHIVKEEMGIRYYYHFADDIVLLDGNKEKFHGTLVSINYYLNNERALSIKPNYQVFLVESRSVNYAGYMTFHDYCLACKQNKRNLCREVVKLRKRGMNDEEIRIKASSRSGFI